MRPYGTLSGPCGILSKILVSLSGKSPPDASGHSTPSEHSSEEEAAVADLDSWPHHKALDSAKLGPI